MRAIVARVVGTASRAPIRALTPPSPAVTDARPPLVGKTPTLTVTPSKRPTVTHKFTAALLQDVESWLGVAEGAATEGAEVIEPPTLAEMVAELKTPRPMPVSTTPSEPKTPSVAVARGPTPIPMQTSPRHEVEVDVNTAEVGVERTGAGVMAADSKAPKPALASIRPSGPRSPKVAVVEGPRPIPTQRSPRQDVEVEVNCAEAGVDTAGAPVMVADSKAPSPALTSTRPSGPRSPKVAVLDGPRPIPIQRRPRHEVEVAVNCPGVAVDKTGTEVGPAPPAFRPRSTVIPLPIPSVTQTSRLAPPQRVEVAVIPASSEERTLEGMSFVGTIPLVSEARMLETSEATEDASETAEVMMPVGTEVTVGRSEIRLLRALVSTAPPVEICDARDDN